ncbi:SNF5-domain-containing protein [Hortaea werneckii]|nr:SNF5-domain-containing protein [Hortaea werneckii]KAI6897394.1 SNF5-domain-containing protein [Hortaea werneckii]KAI6918175.1 SNF5-domain-containing protein [Hortaea werneckii]KAI6952009.1 SNF5-domain-containing protein [Hortaea werneckii]KAI6957915.1 SNF5-domain-containing protein [Hortaea werneckii]
MTTPNPLHQPNAPHAQSHHDSNSGPFQPPVSDTGNPTAQQQSSPSAENQDAIREGKQKAREVMAASESVPGASEAAQHARDTPNGDAHVNGGPPLSRKRSRDGTQLPVSQAPPVLDAEGNERSHDEVLLDRYMQRDMVHGAAMNDQAECSRDLVKAKELEKEFYLNEVKHARQTNPSSIFGPGFLGYGNRITDGKSQIVYSTLRGPPKSRRSKELSISRKDGAQQAEKHEELVPVRLDIELDKLRLRDTFTWNLHEKVISQDTFADYLLEDLKIPHEALPEVSRQVKLEMQDQIQNYYPHIIVEDGPLEPNRPYFEHKDDEMRILVKLNITIGRITLIDQFEWDINNPLNSPEEFARSMAWENALSGEFTTAIAHSIREQSQQYTKSLYLTNHCFDGRPIEDPDVRDAFLPAPIHSAFRPQQAQKDWMPYMYEMSEAELERTETSMMREHRAQKRQLNRRGGPALPDLKERQRTIRSLLVHTVIPGAVETFETTGIPKTRRSARGGRRPGRGGEVDVDSDDVESEESGPDSPAPSMITGGTARTRGMRGAASAAQAAMRANFGQRSSTPDPQLLGLQEGRSSARRSALREESVMDDGDTLVVKLKIGKAKYRAWWDGYRAKKRASEFPLSGYASQPPPPSNPRVGTPQRGGTSTPAMTPRTLPQTRNTPQPNGHHRAPSSLRGGPEYDSQGGVAIDVWPAHEEAAPPPPPWLSEAMNTMRQTYPDFDFQPEMKPYAIDQSSGKSVKLNLEPGTGPPAGYRLAWLPRIRCNDCPGKLYTAVPGRVIEDFDVHLRNRKHLDEVRKRQQREAGQ